MNGMRMSIRALNRIRRLHQDAVGATTLEWALLLAAIVLPSYKILNTLLNILTEYYRMVTFINSLPFP